MGKRQCGFPTPPVRQAGISIAALPDPEDFDGTGQFRSQGADRILESFGEQETPRLRVQKDAPVFPNDGQVIERDQDASELRNGEKKLHIRWGVLRQNRHPVTPCHPESGKGGRMPPHPVEKVRMGYGDMFGGKGRPVGIIPGVVRKDVSKKQGLCPSPRLIS